MTAFAVPMVAHAVSAVVDDDVAVFEQFELIIGTNTALAIAGWFAGPSANDMPYTTLATTGKGDTGELGEAIKRDMDEIEANGEDSGAWLRDAYRYLRALDAWVATFED